MKRKIFVIGIVFLLSLAGFTLAGSKEKKIIYTVTLPNFSIEDYDEKYIEIKIDGSSYLMESGYPVLPKISKTFEIEFGAKNIDIKVFPKNIKEFLIDKEIRPSSAFLPLSIENAQYPKNLNFYSSLEIYPNSWYAYRVGCGLNDKMEHVTFVTVHLFPIRYKPSEGKIYFAKNFEIRIKYEKPSINFPSSYDLVIISPKEFAEELNRLVEHKNSHGVKTFLKTTDEIYSSYPGRDKPEQIKYFIKDAIESYGIKYVLLVGGLKSVIYAKPRDNANYGDKGWYLPVRYTNLYDNPKYPLQQEIIFDPGVACDLYYADIYGKEGKFETWDTNNDGIFAAWNKPGVENDTGLDLYPDVAVGRLACTSLKEVKIVVDKIINYENNPFDEFKKIIVVSGDGFLDQKDLDIRWDTKGLPNGKYTIYAQSINAEGEAGPIDEIEITVDKTKSTSLHFNHDDHLNPALKNGYPAPPIAEIVSVSDGDILGKNDYIYVPSESEAYLNTFNPWANVTYLNEVLYIRGKSYDPKPYGNLTSVHVWIKNDKGEIVFDEWRNNTEMYYEGEWTTGEKILNGRGGALYYMPEDFEREILWASNGKFTCMDDVINAISKGCGFLFMSGHGSPNSWGDHLPGIPGNRQHASLTGLTVTNLRPWFPYISFPVFPVDTLKNGEKLPIAVIGGCHNSQFNVSIIPAVLNAFHLFGFPDNYMWTYGQPVPECLSWRIVSKANGGAIASIGNTGLGYGMPGRDCTTGGGDGWITIEFFRQYGEKSKQILGQAHAGAITEYINSFDMSDFEAGHVKTVQQWILLGDPSLKIGGY